MEKSFGHRSILHPRTQSHLQQPLQSGKLSHAQLQNTKINPPLRHNIIDYYPRGQWQRVPDRLRLREISFVVNVVGFRTRHVTIVTSFLDAKQFPKEAFQYLCFQRWKVELFFKDIKISLAMDTLRCLSPEMIEKELWMFVIAYNLIRTLMLKAAYAFHKDPLRLSFKGTVSSLRQWTPALASPNLGVKDRTHLVQILLMYLAHDTVPLRPNRVEPRARKRRPKNYQLLTAPRLHFKECLNRAKYKKPA